MGGLRGCAHAARNFSPGPWFEPTMSRRPGACNGTLAWREGCSMSLTRFTFAIAALAAAQSGFSQTSPAAVAEHAAARFLDQATWGPTPQSLWDVQQMGINNWLQAQFALNTS